MDPSVLLKKLKSSTTNQWWEFLRLHKFIFLYKYWYKVDWNHINDQLKKTVKLNSMITEIARIL